VHLVRNAIDHGIEPPEQRGGKPPIGRLRIAIARSLKQLRIEIADDGAGIDTGRLLARAIEQGVLDASAASLLSESEKLRLVLAPGLSTAETVSETSGRGVGAGAVRDAVEAVGGSLHVESARGRGTTFVLELPMLAWAPGASDLAEPSPLLRTTGGAMCEPAS
jgi:two-component system chemotaxis sensor kinase CheA